MAPPVPTQVMQGIEVPASSIQPAEFFKLTRRLRFPEKTIAAFAGLGSTDNIPVLQTGIISGITLQFQGNLAVNLAAGTAATTGRWPYDLIRAVRLSANGQSNLINVHGGKLQSREIAAPGDLTDRGVSRGTGGAHPHTPGTPGTRTPNTRNRGTP